MNHSISTLNKAVITIIAFLLSTHFTLAQTLRGKVLDSKTGEPVIGATVATLDASQGVVTNYDGEFSIQVKKLPARLNVRFMGYKKVELDVYDDEEPVTIELTENRSLLINDVVVIGYGTQQRQQLTGAVTSVDGMILENNVMPNVESLLSGSVAGVSVVSSAQPGSPSSIRIRGGNSINASNEPLYVIDGFIYYREPETLDTQGSGMGIQGGISPLSLLNPDDIESIDVLKDVSATAIYGSRGANGVIIVTTKRGQRGKAQITYDYTLTLGSASKRLSVLSATQWFDYMKENFALKGTDKINGQPTAHTDWQDAVLRTAVSQTHNLSISGGDDHTRYSVGGNVTRQQGVVLNTGFNRSSLHANLERDVIKNFNITSHINVNRSSQHGLMSTHGVTSNSSPFQAGITNSLVYALMMPPTVPIYTSTGDYNNSNPYEYAYFSLGPVAANPVSDLLNSKAETIDDEILGNLAAKYTIMSGLVAKAAFGFNIDNLTQNFYAPSYTALGLVYQGYGSIGKRRNETRQTELTIDYTKQISDNHFINALLGYTIQDTDRTYLIGSSANYSNDLLRENALSIGSLYTAPLSGKSQSSLRSVLARVNYTLYDRYNLTATFRADHSSRFAKHHKWGYFPSLGLSWNIEKERFLQNATAGWIDALKLRASFGTVGNQEIGDYEFSSAFTATTVGGVTHYTKTNAGNDKLKWETTASCNVGIDLSAFGGLLSVTGDYYYKRTNDLLLTVTTDAGITGVSTQLKNIGNVSNQGFELGIGYHPITKRHLSLSFNANVAYNRNKVVSLGEGRKQMNITDYLILRPDEPVNTFYGLIYDGVVQEGDDISTLPVQNGARPQAGEAKFRDVNGDGKVDGSDRVVLGSVQIPTTFGFSTNLSWRKLDVMVQLRGVTGNEVYNSLRRTLEQPTDCYNVSSSLLDAWTKNHASQSVPRINDHRPYSYLDSRYVEDGSFIRLSNVTVGYTFKIIPIKAKLRLSATATNLFTLTGYKGYDPEVSGGIDRGDYTGLRSVTLGASLTF